LGLTFSASASLVTYDAKIAEDHGGGAGPLPYEAVSTSSVTFDTTNSAAFDFGAISGSSTIEFILSGNVVDGGRDGFLAVGANETWNLRYEQWDDTGQLGFTHLGVADYLFTPGVDSPDTPTHVTYRWDLPTETMELYLDGELSGSANAPGFEMPTGQGLLGNNAALSEGMLGTIDRVTVYNDALSPTDIAAHADAWLVPEPSTGALAALVIGAAVIFRRRRQCA
jgi:hypothetical protein